MKDPATKYKISYIESDFDLKKDVKPSRNDKKIFSADNRSTNSLSPK